MKHEDANKTIPMKVVSVPKTSDIWLRNQPYKNIK